MDPIVTGKLFPSHDIKGYGEDEKIIAQFPKMNRADLRLVTNISGERELVEGYIPTDEISIKNENIVNNFSMDKSFFVMS